MVFTIVIIITIDFKHCKSNLRNDKIENVTEKVAISQVVVRVWSISGANKLLSQPPSLLLHMCVRFQHTNTDYVWWRDSHCTIVLHPVLRTLFGHQCLIFGQSSPCILTFLSVRINNAPTPSSSFVDRRFFWLKAQRGQHSGEWWDFCFVLSAPLIPRWHHA